MPSRFHFKSNFSEEVNRALSMTQICSLGIGNKEYNENNMDAKERRTMFLIRHQSNNNSLLSSGSGSLDSVSTVQGPKMRRKTREVGRLNPDLYRKMSLSSSSGSSGFGDIRLSYTWIGKQYDQLKIRILKIKNIPVEYYRAGLYIR